MSGMSRVNPFPAEAEEFQGRVAPVEMMINLTNVLGVYPDEKDGCWIAFVTGAPIHVWNSYEELGVRWT
jgi:hypothetical protein